MRSETESVMTRTRSLVERIRRFPVSINGHMVSTHYFVLKFPCCLLILDWPCECTLVPRTLSYPLATSSCRNIRTRPPSALSGVRRPWEYLWTSTLALNSRSVPGSESRSRSPQAFEGWKLIPKVSRQCSFRSAGASRLDKPRVSID
jgi:hypothetical protein